MHRFTSISICIILALIFVSLAGIIPAISANNLGCIIEGTITVNGVGTEGVAVSAAGVSTTSMKNGFYYIQANPGISTSVKATFKGYSSTSAPFETSYGMKQVDLNIVTPVTPTPTATPTVTATATPVPTATPTISPTPTPSPSANASVTPTPNATVTPTPTMTPTATPAPTAKPASSPASSSGSAATPALTATPVPSVTTAPSPTPETKINYSQYVWATPTPTPPPGATPAGTTTRLPGFALLLAVSSIIIAAFVFYRMRK